MSVRCRFIAGWIYGDLMPYLGLCYTCWKIQPSVLVLISCVEALDHSVLLYWSIALELDDPAFLHSCSAA